MTRPARVPKVLATLAAGASALAASRRGFQPPWLRHTSGARDRALCWRDRHLCFASMTSLSHLRASAACYARLAGLIAIFWG